MSEHTSENERQARYAAAELERAREELAKQLEVACATPINPTVGETTGQLRRLDDALLAAARTTEEMIALKQRARAEREAVPTGSVTEAVDDPHTERIREFHDHNGCQWRAWAVIPGQASTTSTRNLGELRDGWLAFESLSGSGKRRLAKYPADWLALSDSELESLLETAADAPVRKRTTAPDSSAPE